MTTTQFFNDIMFDINLMPCILEFACKQEELYFNYKYLKALSSTAKEVHYLLSNILEDKNKALPNSDLSSRKKIDLKSDDNVKQKRIWRLLEENLTLPLVESINVEEGVFDWRWEPVFPNVKDINLGKRCIRETVLNSTLEEMENVRIQALDLLPEERDLSIILDNPYEEDDHDEKVDSTEKDSNLQDNTYRQELINAKFLKWWPKVLSFSGDYANETDSFDLRCVPNIRELALFRAHTVSPYNCAYTPHVTKLTLYGANSDILKYFPNLLELDVECQDFIDLRFVPKLVKLKACETVLDFEALKTLKNLVHLELEFVGQKNYCKPRRSKTLIKANSLKKSLEYLTFIKIEDCELYDSD